MPLLLLATVHFLAPVGSSVYDFTKKFYTVSYYNSETGLYNKGIDDGYLVAFWVVLFTFIRIIMMDFLFTPFAKASGLKGKDALRFSEQAWACLYAIVFWTLGMVSTLFVKKSLLLIN